MSLQAYVIFDIRSPEGGRNVFIDRVEILDMDNDARKARVRYIDSGRIREVHYLCLYSTRAKALAALTAMLDSLPISPPPELPIEASSQSTKTAPVGGSI